jgi:hypothetical protein
VFAALLILIALICASPFVPFVDGHVVIGIEATTMALATALVAPKSPSGETRASAWVIPAGSNRGRDLSSVDDRSTLAVGLYWCANPIWESTRQALGSAIAGSIGIDTGAGLLGLIQYTAVLAILLVTMAVTRDRLRADRVLFAPILAKSIICLPVAELLWRLDFVWAEEAQTANNPVPTTGASGLRDILT